MGQPLTLFILRGPLGSYISQGGKKPTPLWEDRKGYTIHLIHLNRIVDSPKTQP